MKQLIFLACFSLFLSCKKNDTGLLTKGLLQAEIKPNAGIYDASGNRIILRGVNYNVLGDYWSGNPNIPTTKEYNQDDLLLMTKYGFNCIRLVLSWSALAPERGNYNYDYINRIQNVIEAARALDIYVILDMHQDAYSKYIFTPKDHQCEFPQNGWDGAPQWAVFTNGTEICSENGKRESTRAVVNAWQNFWDNTNGIQDEFYAAWEFLIENVGHYKNVAGYDLLNEPSLGYKDYFGEVKKYTRFNRNLINAIRLKEKEEGIGERIIFFELVVTWNGQELPSIPELGFTNDRNIVFSPHHYFESISELLTIEQGLQLYNLLADQYQTDMLIGEWGFFGDIEIGKQKLIRFAAEEDKVFASSTWWQWAQAPGDPHAISWDGKEYDQTSMHLIELNKDGQFTGNINEEYLKILGRSRLVSINGRAKNIRVDPLKGDLVFNGSAKNKGTTRIWIPEYYGNHSISTSNANLVNSANSIGGIYLDFTCESDYTIEITF